MSKATFAAGCFWGVEDAFRQLRGVTATSVGYIGGAAENPTYQQVCTGRTGHAEAVEVEFDPARVSYTALLDLFFDEVHDPTQRDRQGPDIGTQYRSAIFTHDDGQAEAARAAKARLAEAGRFAAPIATEIVPAGVFWPAEDIHQQYAEKRRGQPGGRACAHLG
ncbi:MAG: peptide-methionine (S)-S-oxide reductase MsrA [Alphaproteobacteria bacterium]